MWLAWTASAAFPDELHVGPGQRYTTLGEALAVAVSGDRILLDAGHYTEDLDFSDLSGIEIVGSGSDPVTGTVFSGGAGASQWHLDASTLVVRDLAIDGENDYRAIAVTNGSVLEAWNVRIQHGSQPTGGGIQVDLSTLELHDSVVDANGSTGRGGGLYAVGSVILVDGCAFTGNRSGAEGGGAWVGDGSELDVVGSSFVDGSARSGAGLACTDAVRCTLQDSTFEHNGAVDSGGGLYLSGVEDATILRTALCDNTTTTGPGGAITLWEAAATVRNCSLLDGRAGGSGGGLMVHSSTLTLHNNTFVGDGAGARGGASFQDGTSATRSVNNLYVDSSGDDSPFAAVDVTGGGRSGGYDLYFGNVADAMPAVLQNDIVGVDPQLTPSAACEAPVPAIPGPTINTGDPAILDPDGSRSDLGATGGPDAHRDQDGDEVLDGEDCDDLDPQRAPGRAEECNERDDDCDDQIDEGACPPSPDGVDRPPASTADPQPTGCGCGSTRGGPWLVAIGLCRRLRRRSRTR